MSQTLYRFWSDETLLYVGISNGPIARLHSHSKTSRWFEEATHVTFERHETREQVQEAERIAIRDESPKYNIVGTGKRTYRREDWLEPTLPPAPFVLGAVDPLEQVLGMQQAGFLTNVGSITLRNAISAGKLHAWRASGGQWQMLGNCLNEWANRRDCEHIRDARESKVAA